MNKVFLSFLGTNTYLTCNYFYENKKINNVGFIQEAMLKLFCSNYDKEDHILILLTDKARNKNWDSNKNKTGLKHIFLEKKLQTSIIPIKIPSGNTEDDIWKIFNIIFNNININDELTLDITHAFRYLPMLAFALLNYAKLLKNISVKGIYYGAFEALGTRQEVKNIGLKERNVPIINLTSFSLLQQWSIAVDNFVNYGIAEKLSKLVYSNIKPVLIKSQGKNKEASVERKIHELLNKISMSISTVRGNSIYEGKDFIELKDYIGRINTSNLITKPLKPLLDEILKQISPYKLNSIFNEFHAVNWCIKNSMIQQGITLLQESILTYIIEKSGMDFHEAELREILSNYIYFVITKKDYTKDIRLSKNLDKLMMFKSTKNFNELSIIYDSLRGYRNDINHGGFINKHPAESFASKLKTLYERTKELLMGDKN